MTDEIVRYGGGWVQSDFSVVGPSGPVALPETAIMRMQIDDARLRRLEAEEQAEREDRADALSLLRRPDGSNYASTHAQVIERASAIMAAQDRAAERHERLHPELYRRPTLAEDAQRFRGPGALRQARLHAAAREERERRHVEQDRKRVADDERFAAIRARHRARKFRQSSDVVNMGTLFDAMRDRRPKSLPLADPPIDMREFDVDDFDAILGE
jgi:hypothetical protein